MGCCSSEYFICLDSSDNHCGLNLDCTGRNASPHSVSCEVKWAECGRALSWSGIICVDNVPHVFSCECHCVRRPEAMCNNFALIVASFAKISMWITPFTSQTTVSKTLPADSYFSSFPKLYKSFVTVTVFVHQTLLRSLFFNKITQVDSVYHFKFWEWI